MTLRYKINTTRKFIDCTTRYYFDISTMHSLFLPCTLSKFPSHQCAAAHYSEAFQMQQMFGNFEINNSHIYPRFKQRRPQLIHYQVTISSNMKTLKMEICFSETSIFQSCLAVLFIIANNDFYIRTNVMYRNSR
jgi:hypothetical protein